MTALALVKLANQSIEITGSSQIFLDQVSQTGQITASLLQDLVNIADDEIVELRLTARKLGIYAWVLECACDAEIWERHKPFRGSPGKPDTEGVGIVAAIRVRAREVDCNPKTIQSNYRIYRTFREQLNESLPIIPEKDFYSIALKYKENPTDALNLFINERQKDPYFKPADARRLLARKMADEKISHSETVTDDNDVKQHISSVITKINDFKREAPDKRLITSYYEEWCRQLSEYLEDYSLSINEEKVFRAIERGHHKESQIAAYSQLPIRTVSLILNELEQRGECESVTQRGETEVARGGHIKLWHRIGEPTGDIYEARTTKINFLGDE